MSKRPRLEMAMIDMHRLGLLPVIFPTLNGVHLREIKKRVAAYEHYPEGTDPIYAIMELFPDATPKEADELCRYLHTSNEETKVAAYIAQVRHSIRNDQMLNVSDLYEWAHLYAHPSAEVTLAVINAGVPKEERERFMNIHRDRFTHLKEHIERIIEKRPLVNAARLMQEGVQQGKKMGLLLKEAERIAIFEDLNDTEEVVKRLKASVIWSNEERK
jgi:poly(A) polymerase